MTLGFWFTGICGVPGDVCNAFEEGLAGVEGSRVSRVGDRVGLHSTGRAEGARSVAGALIAVVPKPRQVAGRWR